MRTPLSLPARWLGAAASSVDRAAVLAATWSTTRGASRITRMPHADRVAALGAVASLYGPVGDARLFPEPPLPSLHSRPVRDLAANDARRVRVRVVDVAWESGHDPLAGDVRDAYLAHARNRTARARLFLGPSPRPAVIAIHGYLGGAYAMEERAFPVGWMLRRGFDVALLTLPFHALRARSDGQRSPPFPGADPRFTIEGCRQAVRDARALLGHLRAAGAPAVGVIGMSLGGYVTSLLTTLDERLAFAVPTIPLASFADFARDQGRFGSGDAAVAQYRAYDDAMRAVSPLARPSILPPRRVLVLAASFDRITPKAHAERLAAHFDAPLVSFPGGHLLQFGRGDAFRALGRFWTGLGLGTPARSHRLA